MCIRDSGKGPEPLPFAIHLNGPSLPLPYTVSPLIHSGRPCFPLLDSPDFFRERGSRVARVSAGAPFLLAEPDSQMPRGYTDGLSEAYSAASARWDARRWPEKPGRVRPAKPASVFFST